MPIDPIVVASIALGFLGCVSIDSKEVPELLHYNVLKALNKNDITVVYDESTAVESKKFVKFAFQEGMSFSYVNANKMLTHMKLNNLSKQMVVLCNYSNMEWILMNFTARKMMVLPYIWVFVTEDDLKPLFTDESLGLIIAVSNKSKTATLYSKGCRGLNVTKFPEITLQTLVSFEALVLDLKVLQGCTLTVVVLDHKPLSFYNAEESEGYDVDAIRVLAEATGQKLSFVKSEDNIFGQPTSNGWTGNLGVLERNEQDVAIPFFILTKERSRSFTTSKSVHVSQWVGLVKTKPVFSATGVFKPFSLGIWMSVICSAAGLAICYTFSSFQLYSWKESSNNQYSLHFLDKCFHAWTSFLQQESRPKGDLTSGRILLLAISAYSLIILTAYSSVLYAVLSSTELDIPFNSMEGLLANDKYRPVWESTPVTMGVNTESNLKSFREVTRKFLTPDCGFSCLRTNHKKAMDFVNRENNIVYFLIKDTASTEMAEDCKYAIAIDNVAVVTFHIHWRKGFVHSRYIDPYIMKMTENGIITRIYRRAFKPRKTCFHFDMELGIEIMYYPFVILALGILVCLVVLIAEMLFKFGTCSKFCTKIV